MVMAPESLIFFSVPVSSCAIAGAAAKASTTAARAARDMRIMVKPPLGWLGVRGFWCLVQGAAASGAKDTARRSGAARRKGPRCPMVRTGVANASRWCFGGEWRFPVQRQPPSMHFPTHEQKQALLEQVMRLADQRLEARAGEEARAFIARYYEQVDIEDLASRAPEDLYGAAMAHLAFARQFASGTPKIRVYNPRAEEHGWTSPYTVIEIVNDDMPFLVDSVSVEVNRQGYTLHLLNHPIFSTRRDAEGHLQAVDAGAEGRSESLMHVEVDRELDATRLKA